MSYYLFKIKYGAELIQSDVKLDNADEVFEEYKEAEEALNKETAKAEIEFLKFIEASEKEIPKEEKDKKSKR